MGWIVIIDGICSAPVGGLGGDIRRIVCVFKAAIGHDIGAVDGLSKGCSRGQPPAFRESKRENNQAARNGQTPQFLHFSNTFLIGSRTDLKTSHAQFIRPDLGTQDTWCIDWARVAASKSFTIV